MNNTVSRSPPRVLESVGISAQQQYENLILSGQRSLPAPPEEHKHILKTPSPVRRSNQANMLLSASNQPTAYRPYNAQRPLD